MNNENVNSIYIHIPFCKKICNYCDFCKVLYQEDLVNIYLDELKKEIEDAILPNKIKTLYIGGGTPSSLSIINLKKLLNLLNAFNLDSDYEFTFECNLDDIGEELLTILREYKVNRLSIGVESFNYKKLEILGRNAEFKDAQAKIALCRKLGFNNINIDLIYGVTDEDLSVLKSDLKKILKLNPEHISAYSLMIENNTILKIKNIHEINDTLDSKMYHYIIKKLKGKKYNHYEISNFSKLGYESKHNLVYWNNEEYYGFGLGASGYFSGVRYSNVKNMTKYLNGEYIQEKNILSKKEIMEYELILGLRKTKGINIKHFYQKFNENIQDIFPIEDLIKIKDLLKKEDYIFINPKKLYLMNEILLKLLK